MRATDTSIGLRNRHRDALDRFATIVVYAARLWCLYPVARARDILKRVTSTVCAAAITVLFREGDTLSIYWYATTALRPHELVGVAFAFDLAFASLSKANMPFLVLIPRQPMRRVPCITLTRMSSYPVARLVHDCIFVVADFRLLPRPGVNVAPWIAHMCLASGSARLQGIDGAVGVEA